MQDKGIARHAFRLYFRAELMCDHDTLALETMVAGAIHEGPRLSNDLPRARSAHAWRPAEEMKGNPACKARGKMIDERECNPRQQKSWRCHDGSIP